MVSGAMYSSLSHGIAEQKWRIIWAFKVAQPLRDLIKRLHIHAIKSLTSILHWYRRPMATTSTTEAGGGAYHYKLTQWGAGAILHWRKSCLRDGRTKSSFLLVFPQSAQP